MTAVGIWDIIGLFMS